MSKKLIYGLLSVLLLASGIGIFLFATHIPFLRYSVGDFLVVMFMYTAVKTIFPGVSSLKLVIGVLTFSISIEVLQLFGFPKLLGTDKVWVKLIFGSHFVWSDILAYFLGIITIYWIDNNYIKEPNENSIMAPSVSNK